jgi:hypothetical protein
MIPLVVYEELPEGLTVMLREEDGRDVIVINSQLSRVERRRAREAGMHMLRDRRGHALIPVGGAIAEWVTRLRDWVPAVPGPATALAGGAMAMSLAASAPLWPGYGEPPPAARPHTQLALPAPTGEVRAPATVVPVSATTRGPSSSPSPSARSTVRPATGDPIPAPTRSAARRPSPRPAEESRESATARERDIDTPATGAPADETAEKTADVVVVVKPSKVRKVVPTRLPAPVEARPVPDKVVKTSTAPAPVPLPSVKATLPDVPLKTGDCGGLVSVEVKPLPKTCVGG